MDVTRQHLFAGSRFTADHDGRITGRHAAGEFDQFTTTQVFSHHLPTFVMAARQIALNLVDQVVDLERLGEVVEDAQPTSRSGGLDGAVAGNQQDNGNNTANRKGFVFPVTKPGYGWRRRSGLFVLRSIFWITGNANVTSSPCTMRRSISSMIRLSSRPANACAFASGSVGDR